MRRSPRTGSLSSQKSALGSSPRRSPGRIPPPADYCSSRRCRHPALPARTTATGPLPRREDDFSVSKEATGREAIKCGAPVSAASSRVTTAPLLTAGIRTPREISTAGGTGSALLPARSCTRARRAGRGSGIAARAACTYEPTDATTHCRTHATQLTPAALRLYSARARPCQCGPPSVACVHCPVLSQYDLMVTLRWLRRLYSS